MVYTEMLHVNAILHGNANKLLAFHPKETPVALQLGGNNANDLAKCAKLGEDLGYSEINLNCGCPSDKVVKGAFGAGLMTNPTKVGQCVEKMVESVSIPVTVKHRLGLGIESKYHYVYEFVDTIRKFGCHTFIVHARNAILGTLSPKENREIPPLHYDYVTQLKKDFPDLTFVLNGGIRTVNEAIDKISRHDGIMIGRAAYQDPYILRQIEHRLYNTPLVSRADIALEMEKYVADQLNKGTSSRSVLKCMLGLFRKQPYGKLWRQLLTKPEAILEFGPGVISYAVDRIHSPHLI